MRIPIFQSIIPIREKTINPPILNENSEAWYGRLLSASRNRQARQRPYAPRPVAVSQIGFESKIKHDKHKHYRQKYLKHGYGQKRGGKSARNTAQPGKQTLSELVFQINLIRARIGNGCRK